MRVLAKGRRGIIEGSKSVIHGFVEGWEAWRAQGLRSIDFSDNASRGKERPVTKPVEVEDEGRREWEVGKVTDDEISAGSNQHEL